MFWQQSFLEIVEVYYIESTSVFDELSTFKCLSHQYSKSDFEQIYKIHTQSTRKLNLHCVYATQKSDILIGWVVDRRTAPLSEDEPNIVIEHTEYKKSLKRLLNSLNVEGYN